jgi:hypothetical protein
VFFSPLVNHGLAMMGPVILLLTVSGELSQHGIALAMFAVSLTHWWVSAVLAPPRCDDLSAARSRVNPSLLLLPLGRRGLLDAFCRAHRTYCFVSLLVLAGVTALIGVMPRGGHEISLPLPGGEIVRAIEWTTVVQDGPREVVQLHRELMRPSLVFTPLSRVPFWQAPFALYFLGIALVTGGARFARALGVEDRARWPARVAYGVHAALACALVADILLPWEVIERVIGGVGP